MGVIEVILALSLAVALIDHADLVATEATHGRGHG